MLKRKLLILLSFLYTILPAYGATEAPALKHEALSYLVTLSSENTRVLKQLDQEIRDILMKSHNSNLSSKSDSRQLTVYSNQLEKLSLRRKEYFLRQNFIDRIKFKIDQQLDQQEMKDFLSKLVLEMAHEEALDPSGDIGMAKFCNFLSLALRQIPERNENLLGFIEGYMKFSSILNPLPPTDYIGHRSYTNGVDSYHAKNVSNEEVGDIVEERLKQIEANDQLGRKAFGKRAPISKSASSNVDNPSAQQPSTTSDDTVIGPIEQKIVADKAIESVRQPSISSTEANAFDTQWPESSADLKLRIQLKEIHNPDAQTQLQINSDSLTKKSTGYE